MRRIFSHNDKQQAGIFLELIKCFVTSTIIFHNFDKKLGNVTSTTLYNYLCLNESNLPKKGISIFIMSKVKIQKKFKKMKNGNKIQHARFCHQTQKLDSNNKPPYRI